MGTQGPGRKRIPNLEKLTAEDDALSHIAREAEARLAAKRAARAEAREIRMKELERQQKEVSDDEEKLSVCSRGSLRPSDYSGVLGSGSRASSRASSARASPVVEERPERDFIDKGSRTASTLSAATLACLGGASSRRGSCDTSFSVETEASIRDMKDSLVEMEERYRRAMVSNAQLHNDKSTLMYQVETLKEELSDLEELLWEGRRTADERSKELERQRQKNSVLQFQLNETTDTLRRTEELLTERGVVVSDDVTTNGETGQKDAEDDVCAQSASRLAQEASHGGRESMLGKVRDEDVLQMDEKCQNPRGSGTFTDPPKSDQGFQTKKLHKLRPVPPGSDGDVLLENKPKVKEHKAGPTQPCPQKWTFSSNQRFQNEDENAAIFSNQLEKQSQTLRTEEIPNDPSPSQSLQPDLNEDQFRDGSGSERLYVNDQTEGRGDHDDRSPSVLVQTFTNRIILEELLRRFLQHENFTDEISQTFPEMSEALHWGVSGLEEPQGGRFNQSVEGEPTPETPDRSEHPPPDASVDSTNQGREDISPQNQQELSKDSTKCMTTRTDSDVQPRRSADTEHLDDFIVVDFYGTERVQTRSNDPRGKTTVQRQEDVNQNPTGNPSASTNSQSSKVRGGETKVTAVPDWSSGGGTAECHRTDESTGLSGLTDSCEEADEEAATPRDHQQAVEAETEKGLLRTRDKSRGNCRIC